MTMTTRTLHQIGHVEALIGRCQAAHLTTRAERLTQILNTVTVWHAFDAPSMLDRVQLVDELEMAADVAEDLAEYDRALASDLRAASAALQS